MKTEYGYHILEVTGIDAVTPKPYAEVKDQITKDYQRQQAENKFLKLEDTLDRVRYEHSDSLEMAAEAVGEKIQATGLFNQQTGSDIATEKAVRDAAFSKDVLEGSNSDIIELGSDRDRVVVVRVKEHRPATTLALDAVKESVVQTLNQRAAHDLAVKTADEIVAKAGQSLALNDLASKYDLPVEKPGFVTRDNKEISWQIKQGIFSAPKPGDKPSVQKVDLGPQGQAVMIVKSVKQGDPKEIDAAMRDQVEAQLLKNRNAIEYTALIGLLEESGEVSVQKDLQQSQ